MEEGSKSVVCLVVNDTALSLSDESAGEVLAALADGEHGSLRFVENGVEGLVRREGDAWWVEWRPSPFMRKKEEMLSFSSEIVLSVSPYQPFFKFVNTNGSKLVRCLLVDQGYLEVLPER